MYAICFNATLVIIIIISIIMLTILILFTGPRQLSKYINHTYLQIIKGGSARLSSKSEIKKNKQQISQFWIPIPIGNFPKKISREDFPKFFLPHLPKKLS